MYMQDERIQNSIVNAKVIEKVVHMLFYRFKIKKAVDVLSTRGEFFHKYCDFGDEQLMNCRALMIRIMALACHFTFEEFEIFKNMLTTTTLKSAHSFQKNINVDEELLRRSYPQDICLKKVTSDIFLEGEMENFATSLFVYLKMRMCPEQVFQSILVFVLYYYYKFYYRM